MYVAKLSQWDIFSKRKEIIGIFNQNGGLFKKILFGFWVIGWRFGKMLGVLILGGVGAYLVYAAQLLWIMLVSG